MLRAIILAAGRGKRLAEFNTDQRPKCLIEIGGKSLLERQLELLESCGVDRVDLVVGYEAGQIRAAVEAMARRPDVEFHHNPRFEQGSVISLWTARDPLESGDPVLVLDADVLCHPDIMRKLVSSPVENCLLLDRDFETGDEPVKIALLGGAIVEFRKRLPDGLDCDALGESVGFFRFGAECAQGLAERCAQFDAEGLADSPHEDAIRAELLDRPEHFGVEDITGLPWIEIDFAEDIERARETILPAIRQDYANF